MSQKIVIIGAGGFACQLLDFMDACNRSEPRYEILGCIVEPAYGEAGVQVNGFPILGDFDWFGCYQGEVLAVSAVAAPEVRFRLVERAKEWGVRFCNVADPTAVLTRHMSIGEDVVLGTGCIVNFQSRIGSHVHVNLQCTIGERAVLEDFVTLAPAVHISGSVTIGRGAFIGTGANINEKLHIGEWSVIGAGSTIIHDVPPNTTVVGVPGKVIKTREAGWYRER
ncbi:MAG TPA: acetyltransferase [Syntrophorhabdales bacterium]|nr:acetyltransferase [Syntrophorhabdales bacterium]